MKEKISIGLVGDTIKNRWVKNQTDPCFVKLASTLQNCDAVFANLESLYHNWEMTYRNAYLPFAVAAEPELLEDLKWLGISAGSCAMNHSYDCGEAGLVATIENCRKYQFPVAGIGHSLGEARAPVFVDTAGARLALLAGTTPFDLPEESHAGPPGVGIPGKPGVSILRLNTTHTVPHRLLADLQDAQRKLVPHPSTVTEDKVQIFGGTVKAGDDFGTVTECNKTDLEQIATSIQSAKLVSDIVIYSFHCHENGMNGEYYNGIHRDSAPEFLINFAHHCIDNGCDIFFAHGPHIMRGVEIYKGKPIFYSLGNFFFELATIRKVPPFGFMNLNFDPGSGDGAWGSAYSAAAPYFWDKEPECYQSVVPICEFERGELTKIRLIPIELGFGMPHSQRGRPGIAPQNVANEILEWLRDKSEPFGTEIGDGSGFIQLDRS